MILEENLLVILIVPNPNVFTLKKCVMSERNLYELKGFCYFVNTINKTMRSPPDSNNFFVNCWYLCFLFAC